VLIDSASVIHTGEARFVATTVVRFAAPVGTHHQADRQVDIEELDCAAARTRGWWTMLYLGEGLVRLDSLGSGWKPVDGDWRPVFDATCTALRQSFAGLPVEPGVDEVDSLPQFLNRDEVAHTLATRYPPSLARRGRMGGALLWVRIGEDGSVEPAFVRLVWAAAPEFGEVARQAAATMRFAPALRAGRPAAVWWMMPVSFELMQFDSGTVAPTFPPRPSTIPRELPRLPPDGHP
jgi:TonB family protein